MSWESLERPEGPSVQGPNNYQYLCLGFRDLGYRGLGNNGKENGNYNSGLYRDYRVYVVVIYGNNEPQYTPISNIVVSIFFSIIPK